MVSCTQQCLENAEGDDSRLVLIRQDSLLAACFDRRTTSPSGTQILDPYHSGPLSHKSAMDHMVDFVLRSEIIADESDRPNLILRRDLANALDIIKRRTQRENNNRAEPTDIEYQCQIQHLELQFGFVKAWLCRPALRHLVHLDSEAPDASLEKELYATCLQSSRECLYAFVQLNSLCIYPLRSWSVIHNGLSSLLLLALTGEMRRDSHLRTTLGELLDVFESSHAISGGDHQTFEQGAQLSPAYTRAVKALRQMFLRDSDTNASKHDRPTASTTESAAPMYIHLTSAIALIIIDAVTRRQTHLDLRDERASGVTDPLSQSFDFLDDLPPLDAFDSILWYVILSSLKVISLKY
jgi:hypothetical protein